VAKRLHGFETCLSPVCRLPGSSSSKNGERAEVTLKGSGEDPVFTEQHSTTSDGIDVHANSAAGSTTRSSSSNNSSEGIGIGQHESTCQVERRHEAAVSVRLVNRERDIIWSSTKEG
jgi:hypothetical protein